MALISPAYDDRDGVIWLDDEFVDWRSARVPLVSEGLFHGVSVFEGEKIYDGTIFFSRRHSERLKHSASLLGFDLPYSVNELEWAKRELVDRNGYTQGYVRLVAWVESPFKPQRKLADGVRVAAAVWDWGNYYATKATGVKLTLASWRRPPPDTVPFQAKAAGLYVISTLAKHDAEDKGFGDALMLDWRGLIAEATSSNVFFVRDGELHTPFPDCFLNGLTCQTVLALARHRRIQVYERAIGPEEIVTFDDCFLTGTACELSPVTCVDSKPFFPSAITKTLLSDYTDFAFGRICL